MLESIEVLLDNFRQVEVESRVLCSHCLTSSSAYLSPREVRLHRLRSRLVVHLTSTQFTGLECVTALQERGVLTCSGHTIPIELLAPDLAISDLRARQFESRCYCSHA